MKFIFLVVVILFSFISCKEELKDTESSKQAVITKDNYDKKEKKFFPVYQFSKNSYGIVFNLTQPSSKRLKSLREKVLDSTINLFYDREYNDYLRVADTTGNIPLFKNSVITENFKEYIGETYYLILNDKVVVTKVEDILFYTNECITSFILLKLDYELKNSENPIMCSSDRVRLDFSSYQKKGKMINNFLDSTSTAKENLKQDYKVLGSFDQYKFIVYKDDFDRAKIKSNSYYQNLIIHTPTRLIFSLKKETPEIIFEDHIDLYGEPCL